MSRRYTNSSPVSDTEIAQSSYGLTPYALILIALAVICFIGAYIQNAKAGKSQSFTFSPDNPDQTETLLVAEPNTIYSVRVSQSPNGLPKNSGWSDVAIIVRSEKGDQLLSFGGDFWRASGYDEGPWSEIKNSYSMKVTFPLKGSYPLAIESSSSQKNYSQPVNISFQPRRGSTLPLLLLGLPALIIGVFMGYLSNRRTVNEKLAEWSESFE